MANKLGDKPGKLYAYKTDITIENEIIEAIEWTVENIGPISILVNNAGILRVADLADLSTEKLKAVFNTNIIGLSIATREVISNMKKNGIDGHIIQISSIASHISPLRGFGVYCASKNSVNVLTEALRRELAETKSKVKVSVSICQKILVFKIKQKIYIFRLLAQVL